MFQHHQYNGPMIGNPEDLQAESHEKMKERQLRQYQDLEKTKVLMTEEWQNTYSQADSFVFAPVEKPTLWQRAKQWISC